MTTKVPRGKYKNLGKKPKGLPAVAELAPVRVNESRKEDFKSFRYPLSTWQEKHAKKAGVFKIFDGVKHELVSIQESRETMGMIEIWKKVR